MTFPIPNSFIRSHTHAYFFHTPELIWFYGFTLTFVDFVMALLCKLPNCRPAIQHKTFRVKVKFKWKNSCQLYALFQIKHFPLFILQTRLLSCVSACCVACLLWIWLGVAAALSDWLTFYEEHFFHFIIFLSFRSATFIFKKFSTSRHFAHRPTHTYIYHIYLYMYRKTFDFLGTKAIKVFIVYRQNAVKWNVFF